MKSLVVGTVLSALSVAALADSYNVELNAGLGKGEIGNVDVDSKFIEGSFYFDSVSTSKGPLAEAAFLNKASSLSASWMNTEAEGGIDEDFSSLSGRFVFGEDWIVTAGYNKNDFGGGEDADSQSIGVGKYLSDTSELLFNHTNADEYRTYGLAYHNLMSLSGGSSFAIDLAADYRDGDGSSSALYTAGGTWYLTDNFGLGAEFTTASGDSEEQLYTLDAKYFFTPSFAVSLAYLDGEKHEVDVDGYAVGATLRF